MRRAERRLVLCRRLGQLTGRNEARHRRDLRDIEEDEQAALDERHHVDLPDRQRVEPQRDRHAQRGERATAVAQIITRLRFHRSISAPTGSEKSRYGKRAQPAGDAGRGGGVRDRQDQQRVDDRQRGGTERRDDLPAPQQHVVPILPDRRCDHRALCPPLEGTVPGEWALPLMTSRGAITNAADRSALGYSPLQSERSVRELCAEMRSSAPRDRA